MPPPPPGGPWPTAIFYHAVLACERWENVHKPQMLSKVSVDEIFMHRFKTCLQLLGALPHSPTRAPPLDSAEGLLSGVGKWKGPLMCLLLEKILDPTEKLSDSTPQSPLAAWWRGSSCPVCKNFEPFLALLVLLSSHCSTRWGFWGSHQLVWDPPAPKWLIRPWLWSKLNSYHCLQNSSFA